ncbi:MAG: outer membrane beta-barrel domain-containing protein [Steroidobacteraceae bacterium]
MESRLRLFLLIPLLASLSTGCALFGRKAAPEDSEPSSATVVESASGPTTTAVTEPVIDPKIERRKVKTPNIDSENFELGAYGGILSIEDFGSRPVIGARLAYHVTEGFFLEGSYGRSKAGVSGAESINQIQILNEDGRQYSYYALSAGWNALPGEVFVGENRAYNTALYFIVGVGSTHFANDNRFTVNGGFGYRILLTDWLATHLDVRDYLYDTDLLGTKKVVNNLEASLGLSFFF